MSLPQLLHSGTADIDVKLFQSPGFHTVLVKLVTERFSPDLQLIVEVFVICLLIFSTLAPIFVNLSINTLLKQHLISQLSDFFSSFPTQASSHQLLDVQSLSSYNACAATTAQEPIFISVKIVRETKLFL